MRRAILLCNSRRCGPKIRPLRYNEDIFYLEFLAWSYSLQTGGLRLRAMSMHCFGLLLLHRLLLLVLALCNTRSTLLE